jgi:hypothetical protein
MYGKLDRLEHKTAVAYFKVFRRIAGVLAENQTEAERTTVVLAPLGGILGSEFKFFPGMDFFFTDFCVWLCNGRYQAM